MSIKAIETTYKGYRFRSRLEARWAVFFDHIGWEWEYEPEGFELGVGVRYLPDFKIGSVFIEIKAQTPTTDEMRKAWLLAKATDTAVLFGIGLPDPITVAGGLPGFVGSSPFEDGMLRGVGAPSSYCFYKWRYVGYFMDGATPDEDDLVACNAARSARFEFGQSGARA